MDQKVLSSKSLKPLFSGKNGKLYFRFKISKQIDKRAIHDRAIQQSNYPTNYLKFQKITKISTAKKKKKKTTFHF
jgi:hypothetical protein